MASYALVHYSSTLFSYIFPYCTLTVTGCLRCLEGQFLRTSALALCALSRNAYIHRYKPRPKHPVKVHVWAGISWNGATRACIFDGIMDAEFYCQILDEFLVPFIRTVYPHHHRFMQDNDPKHTNACAQAFFTVRGINWWRTPPEYPDAYPIENMWHELKVYYCRYMYI